LPGSSTDVVIPSVARTIKGNRRMHLTATSGRCVKAISRKRKAL
jgi:hypothetical protein